MPGLLEISTTGKKRRREGQADVTERRARKAPKAAASGEDSHADILQLETQILQGNQHLNNIVTLQGSVNDVAKDQPRAVLAAVALCRVFCRLIASDRFVTRSQDSEQSVQIVQWLKSRLRDYTGSIALWIGSPDAMQENTAITLLMRVVKMETLQESNRADQSWLSEKGTFSLIVKSLLEKDAAESGREEFVEKYVNEYCDVRYYTLLAISRFLETSADGTSCTENTLDLLLQIHNIPTTKLDLQGWYGATPPDNSKLSSLSSHRKVAQECWLSVFRGSLTTSQRKNMLSAMVPRILPWFATRMELLTDFLTDSFNAGGALSLLALAGLFHLMTQRNLDYPDFYKKLYSLLDQDLLHSSHRSRFFRLLNKFLDSSHLPAALVASFMKRLARLALQAPPGAIVWIVPWTYNMLRAHRSCTFMLHRPHHPAHAIYAAHPNYGDEGMDDPFSMLEEDPMLTNAIDSSLWELHTLRSHWHPNVGTLARILSEQFTKRDYVLEDFLDHSYATLIEAELRKEIKKRPEVEWEIPKRILTADDVQMQGRLNELGRLLEIAMED